VDLPVVSSHELKGKAIFGLYEVQRKRLYKGSFYRRARERRILLRRMSSGRPRSPEDLLLNSKRALYQI